MPRFPRFCLGALAMTLALQPQIAAAQANCVTEDQVAAMAIYSAPIAVRAVNTKCRASLADNGFMAREGASLASRYAAESARVWPTAHSGLLAFVATTAAGDENIRLLRQLPRDSVRPLVDEIVLQKLVQAIPVEDCGAIERTIAAIAPLEPAEAARLVGALASLTKFDHPPICKATRS